MQKCGAKLNSKKLVINSDLANYNFDQYKHLSFDIYPSNITLKVGGPDKRSPSGIESIANSNLGRKGGIYRYVNNIKENGCV